MNKEILKNIVVLYVEDEDDVRDFTNKTLSKIVKKVVIAHNGRDGLKKYEENPDINLILTDINMPKMDGLQMCEEIRKKDESIPIVITSAHSDPSFLKKSIDVNVSGYAMKPIDLYQLIQTVINAVEPIFKKEIEVLNSKLENKIENALEQRRKIIDIQDNMVLLASSEKLLEANKKFLDFFGVEDLTGFTTTRGTLIEQFKIEDGLFNIELLADENDWISEIKKLNEVNRIIKIKDKCGHEKTFTINVDSFEDNENFFVISFSDITLLKEKSNLLEYQANYDQLTGLFNRYKFNDIFKKEIKRDKRYGNALSIIVFNLDNFCNVYEDYDISTSDEILRNIAEISINSVRDCDTIARWADEEFFIILPQTDINGALKVAEKIRLSIQNSKFTSSKIDLTASFGVAKLEEDDDDLSLIKKLV